MPAGRPSVFTEELALTICRRIAEGESLRRITQEEGMPHFTVVMDWVQRKPEFAYQYARARQLQADNYAERVVDSTLGATDRDTAAAARVQSDAYKWAAGKLRPKKYGDRLIVDVVSDMSDEELWNIVRDGEQEGGFGGIGPAQAGPAPEDDPPAGDD